MFSIYLISYLVMLMLPVAGVLYLNHRVNEMSERNCARDAEAALQDVSASLRAQLAWMDSTAGRFLLDYQTTGMIYAGPLTYGDTRVNTFTAFSKHLNELIGVYDADSLGYRMLFQDSELVFDELAMAQGLEFVFSTSLHYEGMSYEEWYGAVFSCNERVLLPAHDIRIDNVRVRALSYNFPIVRRSANGDRKAVLQFFIPESDLIPDSFDPRSTGYLLTRDGRTLAQFGSQTPFPLEVNAISGQTGWLRHGGGLLAYTEVVPGMTLAMLIPEEVAFRDALAMRTPMLLMILLCAAVEGIMCLLMARRNARPIENLASNVNQMLNTPRQGNELAYLHQSMQQLKEDRRMAEQAVQRSRQVETAMLLSRVLYYQTEDAREHLRQGDRIGVELRAGGYCAAVAALSGGAEPAPSFDVPDAPRGMRFLISEGQHSSINMLYMLEGEVQAQSMEQILQHLQQVYALLPAGSRIGVGRCCQTLEDAPFSYNQAVYCLQLDQPAQGVIQFDQVSPSFNSLHFPLEQQQRILNAVKHNNEAVIDQEFDVLLHENSVKRHLSSLLKRTLLSSVEALLLMAAEDAARNENLSDYLRSVHQSADFRTELEILREEFKKIARQTGEKHTRHEDGQRREMQEWLEKNHSDSMLSIGGMAEHFGFSESYFSVLFKELMGEPYSIYLERLRLNRAAELLKTTDISVEEVAQQVGYNNSTTFRRAFKRVQGISPLQYRNQ
ncbi:MAG: helix-turn-helix domain-containing protein [Clostridia bacterium]|nr:helix-turn-helix domain-containing protein [Clostridia bacterium]